MFEYLVSSWWSCLGKIRRYGLVVGGVALLEKLSLALKFQKPMPLCSGLNRNGQHRVMYLDVSSLRNGATLEIF